jgi:hypothetical protein
MAQMDFQSNGNRLGLAHLLDDPHHGNSKHGSVSQNGCVEMTVSASALNLNFWVTVTSVSGAVIAGVVETKRHWSKEHDNLTLVWAKIGAAGAIPTALVLVYAGFDPSVLTKLSGVNVPIAAAGLSLLYLSLKTLTKSN